MPSPPALYITTKLTAIRPINAPSKGRSTVRNMRITTSVSQRSKGFMALLPAHWWPTRLAALAVAAMRVHYLGRELPQVTVSIGVSMFPQDGDSPENLLRGADEALYRAKRQGRDRVERARTG